MNLSVLIGTCDKYSPLWKPFQITFDRYWKFDTENLFIGETIEVPNYTNTKFKTITPGKIPWGSRIIKGVNKCEEDFIFLILEDYFFDYSYTENQMASWLNDMIKYDMNRLQICGDNPPGEQRFINNPYFPYNQLTSNSPYLISVQPSIWKKQHLLNVLKPEYSPWDFELKGSELLIGSNHKIFFDRNIPKTYFNAVRNGFKKSVGWEKFRDKEKLEDFKDSYGV